MHSSSKEEKAHRAFCLPCAFRPVIQKKSQYCSPAGACREPNLSALVTSKLLVASPFPCTKKGKMEKEGFLNSCLGSLTSWFGSTAQQQLVHAYSVCYVKQRHFWSWSGDREGVVVLPTADHTAWPGRGLSWWHMATVCCLLHGSFCQICLLTLVGKPSINPVLNLGCCKFAVAGPAQQKSNPLICWEIKHAAKFKYFVED